MKALKHNFFNRSPLLVAPDLLGKILVRKIDDITLSGRIVETEAYLATDDEASHSFRGLTKRNASLYKDAGTAYVHQIHTQYCLDIVTEGVNIPTGVLIRALEPLSGMKFMQQFRGREELKDLTTGPGKLAQSLKIGKDLDGIDITRKDSPLQIMSDNYVPDKITIGERIGITKAKDKEFRFYIASSRFVSR